MRAITAFKFDIHPQNRNLNAVLASGFMLQHRSPVFQHPVRAPVLYVPPPGKFHVVLGWRTGTLGTRVMDGTWA